MPWNALPCPTQPLDAQVALVMEHDLFRVMVQSLGQAGCESLVRAGVLPWTTMPAPAPAATDAEMRAAAAHARACGEAIGTILLQGTDRPVVRHSA